MKSINPPLVSVIVSTYNSEVFIEEKLQDLLKQSIFEKLQIILVNSGSQQGEHFIVQKYLKAYENFNYIITSQRESIYQAWNRGIKIAKGKFICNSNTDDRLKENALEILSNELEKHPEVGVVYADQYITTIPNQKFNEAYNNKIYHFPNYDFIHLLDRCLIGSQPMWRASIHFKDDIWFNEKYEICGDHDFYIRVAEKYQLRHLDMVLGTFYKSPQKMNKEYQNMEETEKEGFSISFHHLQKHLNSLRDKELKRILKSNILQVLIPFISYRIVNKMRSIFFHKKHFQYPEFTYLIVILIFRKFKKYNKVKYFSNKYLKQYHSRRIKRVLDSITRSEDNLKSILDLDYEK
ncbi:MAG: glycosyltransferase [Ignavibacterium sp.]|nr:glycosyltransferase [Ignavibacterium sp.]